MGTDVSLVALKYRWLRISSVKAIGRYDVICWFRSLKHPDGRHNCLFLSPPGGCRSPPPFPRRSPFFLEATMTGPTVSVPGEETQQPFTEEERRNLTEEEAYELLHPRFEDPPPDAEEADPADREPTDNSNIVDDSGKLESVSLIKDQFDFDEEI